MKKEKTKKEENDEEYGEEEYEEEMEEDMDEEVEDFGDINEIMPDSPPKKSPTRKKTIKEGSPLKKEATTVKN